MAICRYFISFSLNLKQGSHAWQNDLIGKCTADKLGRGDIQAPAGIQITKSVINPCLAKRISPYYCILRGISFYQFETVLEKE